MSASRKPGGGGGSGTPGDSHLVGLAWGQPEVGAHLARAVPRVDPHCPGAGSLTFVTRFNVFLPPTRRYNAAALRPALTKECAPGAARIASTGGSATAARSAAAAASASTGGVAAIARSAACGLMNPRAWRTSSATLVACVKYASVCVSPGGRNSHGRWPARGRPGVGPH